MALIACPECKKKISETADNCPKCGYQLTPQMIAEIKHEIKQKEQQAQKVNVIICSICAIGIVLYLIGSLFSSESPSSKSSTSPPPAMVENDEWDRSVWQVKKWLKKNLNDPSSLEFIEWSPVSKTNDGGFTVRVKYRAKNSFGGYVVENRVFFLNSAGSIKGSF